MKGSNLRNSSATIRSALDGAVSWRSSPTWFSFSLSSIFSSICIGLPPGFLTRLGEVFEKILPVHVVEENILAAVATVHDVVNGTWVLDTELPWHERINGAFTTSARNSSGLNVGTSAPPGPRPKSA